VGVRVGVGRVGGEGRARGGGGGGEKEWGGGGGGGKIKRCPNIGHFTGVSFWRTINSISPYSVFVNQ